MTDKAKIRLKVLDEACNIEKIEKGDWIDLRVRKDMWIPFLGYRLIPLGVCMELPEGYEAHVDPRSSMFKNFGIISAHAVGIIDNSYNGDGDEWALPSICLKFPFTHIKKGERICQFRIVENQPEIEFEKVENLDNEDRGGWGSTGKA